MATHYSCDICDAACVPVEETTSRDTFMGGYRLSVAVVVRRTPPTGGAIDICAKCRNEAILKAMGLAEKVEA